jgi:hypothetical protein
MNEIYSCYSLLVPLYHLVASVATVDSDEETGYIGSMLANPSTLCLIEAQLTAFIYSFLLFISV